MRIGMKGILVVTLTALACNKADVPVRDAGAEKGSTDTAPPAKDASVSLAIDFSVENCPSFYAHDAQALTCTGRAPLAVRFVPLATATVTQYIWNFGDAPTFNSELSPNHVYTTPGVYTVTLVVTGVSGDLANQVRDGFIVVQANNIGDPCDANSQCDQGLFCLCPADSSPCSTGPAHGLCASSCLNRSCDGSQACAGLLTATPPTGKAAAWQAPVCLRECMKDTDCSAGLSCRDLPPWPVGGAWIKGCFAPVPIDVGEPCRDAEGTLRNDLCASGLCADLGANGLCSMSCEGGASCPRDSDCAVLGDGRKLCLRSCAGFACSQDPLLSCVVPGRGALGYQLASPTSPGVAPSYCAATPCTLDNTSIDPCLPTGTCISVTGGGHCVRRSN